VPIKAAIRALANTFFSNTWLLRSAHFYWSSDSKYGRYLLHHTLKTLQYSHYKRIANVLAHVLKRKTRQKKMAYANLKIPRSRRKHVRSLIDALEVEVGGKFTAGQRELAQRCAFTSLAIEDYEMKLLANEVVDPLVLTTLGAQQRRLLAALGLHREPPPPLEPPDEETLLVQRYEALASAKSGKAAV
jgi:hypothetical protein